MTSEGWINRMLTALPGTDDILFTKLWGQRKLLFDGQRGLGDVVDECSARLVAATLRRRERLLVVLPDFQPHRSAFLFATGLTRNFLDLQDSSYSHLRPARLVLYFGTAVGIRDQLRRTSVMGLQMSLGDVFRQQDVSRGAIGIDTNGSTASAGTSNLLSVVTVYGPADPAGVVRAYKPSWIAIDCADAPSLGWLGSLLDEAVRREIAVVAWGQNPLSECVSDFDNYGRAFIWPPNINSPGCDSRVLHADAESILNASGTTPLLPIVVSGKRVNLFSDALREASQVLSQATQGLGGPFVRDAIAVHWRYLRSLESLTVPVDFYEAEAPRFWGLKSFRQLRSTCERFRNACERIAPRLYLELERAGGLLDKAKDSIESQGCALWDGLSSICIEEPSEDEIRIVLFTGEARKRLFLFALLARHNFTEDDLRELRVCVASIGDLRRWMYCRNLPEDLTENGFPMPPTNLTWHPVMVGLPSSALTPRLLPVFLQPKADIVLYPHQCSFFSRRQAEWSERLSPNSNRLIGSIARLAKCPDPKITILYPVRLAASESVDLDVETAAKKMASTTGPLWKPDDTVFEVARLFQADGESAEEELGVTDQAESGDTTPTTVLEETWSEEAIKVHFEQGWCAFFAPDDVINVVRAGPDGTELDQRYVRSLRVGERVLLIYGQQRQSLYDLIISRVHRHPSIGLHLAMIRRWQEDLRVSFEQWRTRAADSAERRAYGARDLNGLLRQMQARGSQLVSTLTLGFWLRGLVLCPLDPEDLRRVAEVLDMGFVRQYHGRISQAANRLRGLHRGLSLKLNRWLEDHATGALHKNDDDVIDTDLGLTFGDIRNSLLVLRVVEIQNVVGPFLRSNLGQPYKDE